MLDRAAAAFEFRTSDSLTIKGRRILLLQPIMAGNFKSMIAKSSRNPPAFKLLQNKTTSNNIARSTSVLLII